MLTAYEITTESGYSWKTNMAEHVDIDTAKKYFMGQRFDIGVYPTECMETVINVEAI